MSDYPRRGEIFWVDFNPTEGSEQGGRRPAVVVSNNIANRASTVVIVVPMTTTIPKRSYPQNVFFGANEPLRQPGTAYCGQVRTVSKDRLGGRRLAVLSKSQLDSIDNALGIALGLKLAAAAST